jgi:hypothetical protein
MFLSIVAKLAFTILATLLAHTICHYMPKLVSTYVITTRIPEFFEHAAGAAPIQSLRPLICADCESLLKAQFKYRKTSAQL